MQHPKTATAGTYYIKGDNGAGCTQVQPVVVTVTIPPTASISYASPSFCRSQTEDQPVTLTGTGAYTGGTFSAIDAGLTINPVTGAITPSTSTVRFLYSNLYNTCLRRLSVMPVTTSVTILAALQHRSRYNYTAHLRFDNRKRCFKRVTFAVLDTYKQSCNVTLFGIEEHQWFSPAWHLQQPTHSP